MKAPGSGESDRNLLSNLSCLEAGDELKIVIADRSDYEWAKALIEEHSPAVPVHFSPVHGELEPRGRYAVPTHGVVGPEDRERSASVSAVAPASPM